MISEVVLQALADHKSILYGSCSKRFGVEFYVELKYLRIVVLDYYKCIDEVLSPPEHPKEIYNLDTATKLAWAKPNKRSGDADLSKDKSVMELPLELQRRWYNPCEGPMSLEGHVADKLYQERALRLSAKGFSDRFPLESSGTSDTRRQTYSTIKSQKTPSKNKEPTHLRRSRRLEVQSTTREKARRERSKSRRKRSGHQETSSDSEYMEGSDDACEDLNSPYKRPKSTPFTQRITNFKYHKRAKLPRNIRVYEGNKDPEDYLGEVAAGSVEMVRPSEGDKGYVRPGWTEGPKRARNRGGPREARRNMGVYTPYPRKDTFTPLTMTLKEILAMESVNFPEPPPLIGTPEKQNLNKFCDYHKDRGHNTNDCYQLNNQIEEAVASGKLPHLVKDIRRNNQRNGYPGRNGVKVINMIRNIGVNIRSRLRRCMIPMIGFSKETYHPLGVIDLRVTLGKEGRSKMMLMTFAIIKCRSPYNIIIGRTGMRSLRAVGSTIHSMIKPPTNQGVITMETSREALQECKHLERVQELWKELLANVLWENREVFAWTRSERTIVPRFVMEHQLKIYPLAKPVVHKRRPMASEGRLALKEKVFHWLKEGLIRKVQYPEWIANTIPIKLASGTWKVQVDYSSLNKVCAKDMYPLSEEGEELASLIGYPYKCFLRLPKEYSQIRMAEGYEEKIRFHTEEGKRTKALSRKNDGTQPKPPPKEFKPNTKPYILQLTAISKFIPKLTKLKHPIREA
ncbi:hypothetical protein Tco_0558996 [Tanacetum coccineum]